ncbi:hypothetical protein [Xanthomonas sp. 3058]|uniref:hypothetical protein n=1 Tax=Xanthomonas sp. 3058 TaxID=3035314 RepID=UPI0016158FDF|nr:hypothetical protein [Xanthomonas sp. 3058]MBB5863747.1 hypothetical protein [Xanthomonas sp. 3058]
MKLVSLRFFTVLFAASFIFPCGAVAKDTAVTLKAQDEYDVTQEKGLRIKQLNARRFGGVAERGEYSTPDIGLNGSIVFGSKKKIKISGRFDITFNDLAGGDVVIRCGSRVIAYDSLEALLLEQE